MLKASQQLDKVKTAYLEVFFPSAIKQINIVGFMNKKWTKQE